MDDIKTNCFEFDAHGNFIASSSPKQLSKPIEYEEATRNNIAVSTPAYTACVFPALLLSRQALA